MIRERINLDVELIKDINYYKIGFNMEFDKFEVKKSFEMFDVELIIDKYDAFDNQDIKVTYKIYEDGILTQTLTNYIKYHYYELFNIMSFNLKNGEEVLLAITKEYNDYVQIADDLCSNTSTIKTFIDSINLIKFLNPSIKEQFAFILYLSIYNYDDLNNIKYNDLKQYIIELLEYYGYDADYYMKNKLKSISVSEIDDCLEVLIIAILSLLLDRKIYMDKNYIDKACYNYIKKLYLLK